MAKGPLEEWGRIFVLLGLSAFTIAAGAGNAVRAAEPSSILVNPTEQTAATAAGENGSGQPSLIQPIAADSLTAGPGCPDGGCPSSAGTCSNWLPECGCSPDGGFTFQWTPDRWCNIDPQIKTSFNSVSPDNVPKGGNYFAIDFVRLYFTGKVTRVIGFELSTDISGPFNQGFTDSGGNRVNLPDTIHLLDADIRFEFNPFINFWAGRFRPPSDRTNLSGPFFINMWELPFVSKYPSIFLGRDDGVAYWGEWIGENGGQLKWQVGVFNGQGRLSAGNDWPLGPATSPNGEGDPEFAMRVVLNLFDPEPGYYNWSTYYGQKNICAIGFALQNQSDAATDAAHHVGNFTGWNVDFLLENKLNEWGSGTLEGAFYTYDVSGNVASPIAGQAGFVFAGWLLPQEIGCGGVCGRLRPFVRYQKYDYNSQAAAAAAKEFNEGWDFGFEYVIKGHNARFTNFYGTRDLVNGPREDIWRTGLQIVF